MRHPIVPTPPAPNRLCEKLTLERPVTLPPPVYRPTPPPIAARVSPLASTGAPGAGRTRARASCPPSPANRPGHCAMQQRPQLLPALPEGANKTAALPPDVRKGSAFPYLLLRTKGFGLGGWPESRRLSAHQAAQPQWPTDHRHISTWAAGLPFPPFSGVILARMASSQLKYYPNLNPSAAVPVEPDEIFRLRPFNSHYRLGRGKEHGQYVPNMKYIFVRTSDGETLLHPRHRHPAIAAGKPVLYAGEAYFNNGTLEWWSNGSGNYRPDAAHAEQAELPMERFYSFDQILKGVHKEAGGSPSRRSSSQNAVSGQLG